jgi:hypothetical protein
MKIHFVLIFLLFSFVNLVQAQTEEEFYDLVSANVLSGFTLTKKENCTHQKYFLKNLYFLDQSEEKGQPSIVVNCKNFDSMLQQLGSIELKLRSKFKTHYHLKNLNLILADVLKNALFEHTISTLMVPWQFDAGYTTVNLKNPVNSLPILLHEYAHYIIHHNYPLLNLATRSDSKVTFYFDALHELMSDILVVSDTQDPNVMVKALQSTKLLQYPNGLPSSDLFVHEKIKDSKSGKIKLVKYLLTARDFDDRRNNLDYIIAKMRNGDKAILEGYFYSPHSLLSPVRKFLWDHVISNPILIQKLGTAGLTKLLFDEMSKFYNHLNNSTLPSTNGPIESFQMINSKLISWLSKNINQKFPGTLPVK